MRRARRGREGGAQAGRRDGFALERRGDGRIGHSGLIVAEPRREDRYLSFLSFLANGRRPGPDFGLIWPHIPMVEVIFLLLLKLPWFDRESCFDCLLILLANRFNSAYYLLLITGKWSGGETSKASGWTFFGVVETRQIFGLRKFMLRAHTVARTEESLLFWGAFLPHLVNATEFYRLL
jgi:hypothetical protein